MKFFNCNNREGFDIDGTMDINEINFDNNLCKWQMVSGPSGTLLQSFDFEQDFDTSLENGDIMKNWYFDMSTPLPGVAGHLKAPVYPYAPNGFHLCSKLLDNQVYTFIYKDKQLGRVSFEVSY